MEPLDPRLYRDLVRRALDEDVRDGDVTTEAIVPADVQARGTFLVKSEGVLAGLDVAFEVFRQLDKGPVGSFAVRVRDGEWCRPGTEVADVVAPARTLLVGERTALNFLQRMSGIATLARRFTEAANGRIAILDTRKTTPTLRALEKYAVRAGGGANHRIGLFDAILIKDNHIALAGGVKAAIDRARAHRPGMPIEIEAATLHDVDLALAEGVEMILLDNMSTTDIRIAVARATGRAKTEISGGVTLERLPELAATGADFVSVGALTHSAPAIDISFEIEPV
ncbi:MAG TPA: carboxylating nicotinate-nucleotide diphosphorylase [Vicinamibacterales bacterium]|nr:carboxylating nicotinate-nucleotide diphosphorylase [Vicinamibacterales bacterium]